MCLTGLFVASKSFFNLNEYLGYVSTYVCKNSLLNYLQTFRNFLNLLRRYPKQCNSFTQTLYQANPQHIFIRTHKIPVAHKLTRIVNTHGSFIKEHQHSTQQYEYNVKITTFINNVTVNVNVKSNKMWVQTAKKSFNTNKFQYLSETGKGCSYFLNVSNTQKLNSCFTGFSQTFKWHTPGVRKNIRGSHKTLIVCEDRTRDMSRTDGLTWWLQPLASAVKSYDWPHWICLSTVVLKFSLFTDLCCRQYFVLGQDICGV